MSERKDKDVRRRRRKFRRQEFAEQVRLTELLAQYLDPSCTVWTSLENRPRSMVAGMLAKRRGVRSGVPDVEVIFRGLPVFIEMKSRAGIASKAQREFRDALIAGGCQWWLVRSARAALAALRLSGVEFRRPWNSPRLARWEGPFADPYQPLPQAPEVAAQRREVARRWLARRKLEGPATSRRRRERTWGRPVSYDGRTFPSRIALARHLAPLVGRKAHAVLVMLQRHNDDVEAVIRRYQASRPPRARPIFYDGRTFPSRTAMARHLAPLVGRDANAVWAMLHRHNDDLEAVLRRYQRPVARGSDAELRDGRSAAQAAN